MVVFVFHLFRSYLDHFDSNHVESARMMYDLLLVEGDRLCVVRHVFLYTCSLEIMNDLIYVMKMSKSILKDKGFIKLVVCCDSHRCNHVNLLTTHRLFLPKD